MNEMETALCPEILVRSNEEAWVHYHSNSASSLEVEALRVGLMPLSLLEHLVEREAANSGLKIPESQRGNPTWTVNGFDCYL